MKIFSKECVSLVSFLVFFIFRSLELRTLRSFRVFFIFSIWKYRCFLSSENRHDFTRHEDEFYFHLIFNSPDSKQLVGRLKHFLKFRCSLLSLTNVCQSNVFISHIDVNFFQTILHFYTRFGKFRYDHTQASIGEKNVSLWS